MNNHVDWTGSSGNSYRYWFANSLSEITGVAGNYAFVKPALLQGYWLPLYFGESTNLHDRIGDHERLEEAIELGMTFVMVRETLGGALVRRAQEADLIQQWNPVLNVQHKKSIWS